MIVKFKTDTLVKAILTNPGKRYGYLDGGGHFFIVQYNERTNSVIAEHPVSGGIYIQFLTGHITPSHLTAPSNRIV